MGGTYLRRHLEHQTAPMVALAPGRTPRSRGRNWREGVRPPAENVCSMLVLGIDPGTASTGYGVVHGAGSRLRPVVHGVIPTRPGVPLERRLADIHRQIDGLLEEHRPEALAIEE